MAGDCVSDKAEYRNEGDIADEAESRPENRGVPSTFQEDPNEDSGSTHSERNDKLAPRGRGLTRIDPWALHPSRIMLPGGTPVFEEHDVAGTVGCPSGKPRDRRSCSGRRGRRPMQVGTYWSWLARCSWSVRHHGLVADPVRDA